MSQFVDMPVSISGLIGIMADSHGQVSALSAGVSVLKRHGCETIYHLGDICDSVEHETTTACLDIIRENRVLAVKGNNEHTIAVNMKDHVDAPGDAALAAFLGELPLVRSHGRAVFAHSLPFENELGLSAMVRLMDPLAAELFFRMFPGHVLFRGHSHTPELVCSRGGKAVARPIPAEEKISLTTVRPCVVTCGALMDGLCLLWDPDNDWIQSLSCPV